MKITLLLFILLATTSCDTRSGGNQTKKEDPKDVLSKTYYVKGMTCGGCIFGVKLALKNSENLNIFDQDVSVGAAVLKFKKDNYQGKKTDCAITKTIEGKTDFTVFLDNDYKIPACFKKGKSKS